MKHFLAVYTGTQVSRESSGWDSLDAAERDKLQVQGIKSWQVWMEVNGEQIVVAGGPLGKTKLISSDGVSDVANNLCGFVVVAAEDIDIAAALFAGHPHFSIFPGDGVEIIECLPTPGS